MYDPKCPFPPLAGETACRNPSVLPANRSGFLDVYNPVVIIIVILRGHIPPRWIETHGERLCSGVPLVHVDECALSLVKQERYHRLRLLAVAVMLDLNVRDDPLARIEARRHYAPVI